MYIYFVLIKKKFKNLPKKNPGFKALPTEERKQRKLYKQVNATIKRYFGNRDQQKDNWQEMGEGLTAGIPEACIICKWLRG